MFSKTFSAISSWQIADFIRRHGKTNFEKFSTLFSTFDGRYDMDYSCLQVLFPGVSQSLSLKFYLVFNFIQVDFSFLTIYFYVLSNKKVRTIVNNSIFFSFLQQQICRFFLTSYCLSIFDAVFWKSWNNSLSLRHFEDSVIPFSLNHDTSPNISYIMDFKSRSWSV